MSAVKGNTTRAGFEAYLPNILLKRFEKGSNARLGAAIDKLSTALMFVDISGFTSLAETLTTEGREGIEKVSSILNDYFKDLIDLIHKHEGDILQFAGDAILVVWPHTEDQDSLRERTLQSCKCALEIQSEFKKDRFQNTQNLLLRVSVGVGDVHVAHLGGSHGCWHILVAGPPLTQLSIAHQQAEAGQFVVSLQAWSLISNYCEGEPGLSGTVTVKNLFFNIEKESTNRPFVAPENYAALSAYLPQGVQERTARPSDQWSAELRRVTVIFINMPDLNYATPLVKAQDIMWKLQNIIFEYDGVINKLSVDEKGASVLAVFGAPHNSHVDDPQRACKTAILVNTALTELGVRSSIGLASGEVFCGAVGCATRKEFTVIGDTVNISARLMHIAAGEILCEETTKFLVKNELSFDYLSEISMKGKEKPVSVYRISSKSFSSKSADAVLTGRTRERAIVRDRIDFFYRTKFGGITIVVGEAGIGKSILLQEFVRNAGKKYIRVLKGSGSSIEKSSPYHIWRAIFNDLLNISEMSSIEERGRAIIEFFNNDTSLIKRAPLLNAILSLNLPENNFTSALHGQVRADNTNDLLIQILSSFCESGHVAIVLEDLHWADGVSVMLLEEALKQLPHVIFAVSIRMIDDNTSYDLKSIISSKHATLINLYPFDRKELSAFICERLNVVGVSKELVDLCYHRTNGHPFFCEQLIMSLKDGGFLDIKDGYCRFISQKMEQDAFQCPMDVKTAIYSRIDRLSFHHQQMLLRTASVIGQRFDVELLQDIYPIEDVSKSELKNELNSLSTQGLILHEDKNSESQYAFKHALIQDAVYALMLYSQKRALHESVARWIEKNCKLDISANYSLLAHHWLAAEVNSKAVIYLEKAATHSLKSGAFEESIAFFKKLFILTSTKSEIRQKNSRIARWMNLCAEAYRGKHNFRESLVSLEKSVKLYGVYVPKFLKTRILQFLYEVLLQLVYRTIGVPRVFKSPRKLKKQEDLTKIFLALCEVNYFLQQRFKCLSAAVRAINYSERSNNWSLKARAFSTLGTSLGIMGLHKAAKFYLIKARKALKYIDDLSTQGHVYKFIMVYALGVGNWKLVSKKSAQAQKIFDSLGDRLQFAQAKSAHGKSLEWQGKLIEGLKIESEIGCLSGARKDKGQKFAWGHVWQAVNRIYAGEPENAKELIEQAYKLLADGSTEPTPLALYSTDAYLRLMDNQDARTIYSLILRAEELFNSNMAAVFYALDALGMLCYVSMKLYERESAAGRETLIELSRIWKYCKYLSTFSRSLPVGRARSQNMNAYFAYLSGKHSKAFSLWKKSIETGEKYDMKFEVAFARYEYARHVTDLEIRSTLSERLRYDLALCSSSFDVAGDRFYNMTAQS